MNTLLIWLSAFTLSAGLERPNVEYKIFQFPANQIPRIDGDSSDWSIVPDSYSIGSDQLKDTVGGFGENVTLKIST